MIFLFAVIIAVLVFAACSPIEPAAVSKTATPTPSAAAKPTPAPTAAKTTQKPTAAPETKTTAATAPAAAVRKQLLIKNALFLAEGADGSKYFLRTVAPQKNTDSAPGTTDHVIMQKNGKEQELFTGTVFHGIVKAGFSHDGRYLALLDTSQKDSVLYLADMKDGSLKNMGEEGFGTDTNSFVWDEKKDVIYAMTGSGSVQLMGYDVAKKDVFAVNEDAGEESPLGINGGTLYYADGNKIMAVDIKSGKTSRYTTGFAFETADGTMAVKRQKKAEEEIILVDLVIKTAGGEKTIAKDTEIDSYTFARDGKALYYTKPLGKNGYELVRYDLASGSLKTLAELKTPDIRTVTDGLLWSDTVKSEPDTYKLLING